MRGWIVATLLLGLSGSANAADAERRVALVIGNGAYQKMPALPNAADDAGAMASLLKTLGFEVIEGTDLDRKAMQARLAQFGKKADGADIALLYYAGQNIPVAGANYLVPLGAVVKSADDLKSGQGIGLDQAVDQTMAHARVKLVFLDASRIELFPSRKILAPAPLAGMKTQEGTLIGYASAPGQMALGGEKGGHSPFTKALLDNIGAPGIEIQLAMTMVRAEVNQLTDKAQLPWGHTYLTSEVYLNPKPADAVAPAAK